MKVFSLQSEEPSPDGSLSLFSSKQKAEKFLLDLVNAPRDDSRVEVKKMEDTTRDSVFLVTTFFCVADSNKEYWTIREHCLDLDFDSI